MFKEVSPGLSKIANKVTDLSDSKLQKFLSSLGPDFSQIEATQIDPPSEDSVIKNEKSDTSNLSPLIRFLSLLGPVRLSNGGTTSSSGKCPPVHVLRGCSMDDLSLVLQEKLFQQFYLIASQIWKNFMINKNNIFSDNDLD